MPRPYHGCGPASVSVGSRPVWCLLVALLVSVPALADWQMVGDRIGCYHALHEDYVERIESYEWSMGDGYRALRGVAANQDGFGAKAWGLDFTFDRSTGYLLELPRFWVSLELVTEDGWVESGWRQVLAGRTDTAQVDSVALANFSAENYEALVKLLPYGEDHLLFVATATDLPAWFQLWDSKTGAIARWSKSAGIDPPLFERINFELCR